MLRTILGLTLALALNIVFVWAIYPLPGETMFWIALVGLNTIFTYVPVTHVLKPAARGHKPPMRNPGQPKGDPAAPTFAEHMEMIRERNELRMDNRKLRDFNDTLGRNLGELQEKLDTVVPIDPSCLKEGFAYIVTHMVTIEGGRFERSPEIIGWTTNKDTAQAYVKIGKKVSVVQVWVLPDGRIAHRRGATPSLNIIKEIAA